ncbi:MAG: ABC transporter permease [Dehalococcoidales bacterium]|nr:ABC transporter permease [Dehalococcoidales bacterium]
MIEEHGTARAEQAQPLQKSVEATGRRSALVSLGARLVREKPLGFAGAVITLLLLIVGISADVLAPYGFNDVHLIDSLSPPSAQYLLGTDNLGRDLLSRIIYGARISMIIGLAATSLSTIISTVIGVASGYFGGFVDMVLQRLVDAWMVFPGLVLLMAIISLLGPGLWQIIIVLGVSLGIGGSRVIRSAVMAIKENTYMEAARAVGCSPMVIATRHILPNIMAPIIVLFSTRVAGVILAEASLSFLGLGIPPPVPSWGGMLSGAGRTYMTRAPWMAIWPGLALTIVVYGVNMFGDAVRDLLDPRLRGGIGRYSGAKVKRERVAGGK